MISIIIVLVQKHQFLLLLLVQSMILSPVCEKVHLLIKQIVWV